MGQRDFFFHSRSIWLDKGLLRRETGRSKEKNEDVACVAHQDTVAFNEANTIPWGCFRSGKWSGRKVEASSPCMSWSQSKLGPHMFRKWVCSRALITDTWLMFYVRLGNSTWHNISKILICRVALIQHVIPCCSFLWHRFELYSLIRRIMHNCSLPKFCTEDKNDHKLYRKGLHNLSLLLVFNLRFSVLTLLIFSVGKEGQDRSINQK